MVLSCSKTATDSVCTWCFVVITLLYSIDNRHGARSLSGAAQSHNAACCGAVSQS